MGITKLFKSKLMIWGVGLSLAYFSIVYFFFENKICEYRYIYSVSSDDYPKYVDNLSDFYSSQKDYTLTISPGFESIHDNLKEEGIRRFELKLFYSDSFKPDSLGYLIGDIYFNDFIQIETPELFSIRFIGTSTPLKNSLGGSLLIMSLFLLIDFIVFIRKR